MELCCKHLVCIVDSIDLWPGAGERDFATEQPSAHQSSHRDRARRLTPLRFARTQGIESAAGLSQNFAGKVGRPRRGSLDSCVGGQCDVTKRACLRHTLLEATAHEWCLRRKSRAPNMCDRGALATPTRTDELNLYIGPGHTRPTPDNDASAESWSKPRVCLCVCAE